MRLVSSSTCLALSWVLSLSLAHAAILESPAHGGVLSGLGFISGWKCDGTDITVTVDEGEHLSVAMHQERGDLREVCGGTIRHGFIMQMNWNLVGDGEHVAVAYDDGVEFARATFTVGTAGEEFLEEVFRERIVVVNFPVLGKYAVLEWNKSTQSFEIETVMDLEHESAYDRNYWQQYTEDQVARTYWAREFLYAELPDLATCFAGRLTYAAKNRALEAANQIRALHGLAPVIWRTGYSEQVQEAALIQRATFSLSHHPEPSAECYTPAGAEGSGTSNLAIGNFDPAEDMVGWTNDAANLSFLAAAGHRRWVLNPFASYFAYGHVYGAGVQKVFGFDRDLPQGYFRGVPVHSVQVDFVALPYEVYPFHLVEGGAPWSFSVIEDPRFIEENWAYYFQQATITVTHAEDGTELPITDRYTDATGYGVPNFLSWQVQGWEYDTPYEVEIGNVAVGNGERRNFAYPVFIERERLVE